MRYYDTTTTPIDGKTPLEGGANRYPQTDPQVSIYFQEVDLVKYDRGFDAEGFPTVLEYELDENGNRYSHYILVDGVMVPDEDAILEQTKENNSATAKAEQDIAVKAILEDNQREALGLVPLMDNASRLDQENYIQLMQGQVDNPTTDPVYNPPLPPSVVPPAHETLTVAVQRVEGWEGKLGWKATITSMTPDFVPTNLAMAWYNNLDCDGYVGTSGGFVQNAETGAWEGVCPAGFEPEDTDINFGLLYGAAELACFTLPAGQMEKVFNVYDAEEA